MHKLSLCVWRQSKLVNGCFGRNIGRFWIFSFKKRPFTLIIREVASYAKWSRLIFVMKFSLFILSSMILVNSVLESFWTSLMSSNSAVRISSTDRDSIFDVVLGFSVDATAFLSL